MLKYRKNVFGVLVASALVVALSACQPEGPVEKAGKEVDMTVEKAGAQMEKAGDKVKDMANDAKN